jgi:hypothetical protein
MPINYATKTPKRMKCVLGQLIAEQKATVGLNRGSLRRGSNAEPRDEASNPV